MICTFERSFWRDDEVAMRAGLASRKQAETKKHQGIGKEGSLRWSINIS